MKIVLVILKLFIICFKGIKSDPKWSYEILEMNVINNTPDVLYLNMELERLSRGRFGFSGNITIKQELTDEFMLQCDFFYSPTGSNYLRSPLRIPQIPLSKYINTYYRDLLLDSFKGCSKNVPLIATEDPFVPPLTKRVVKFNKCVVSNDNMPSFVKEGFYKMVFSSNNQADSTLMLIAEVEAV